MSEPIAIEQVPGHDGLVADAPTDPASASEEIHRRHGRWIRAVVRRWFPQACDDLAQEVMLKIQQGVGALRASDDAQTRAWIAQTIRSVCIDEVRRRKRIPGFVALDETVPASTDRVVADAETRDRVEHLKNRAWAVLSARERQVLSLRFHEGLSFRQIAELLDVPQGSVTGWYSRALLRLREAIQ